MIEHFQLYPISETDPALEIGDSEDPYSFQITFIFPSGFSRDFSGTQTGHMQPDIFRDPENRKHTERQIRKACPSHIHPRILFVDRVLPGSASSPDDPSFDNFEQRFKAWFEMKVVDEMEETVIAPLKNDLVEIVNNIYQDLTA